MRRVDLIAEVASNHGGDLSLAKEFIYRYTEAGADWIKFQMTRVAHLRPSDPQFSWFERAELSDDALAQLAELCGHCGVKFLCTVYNAANVPMLRSISPHVKVGAGEGAEKTLAEAIFAANFTTVIVSNPVRALWIKPMNKGYKKPRLLPLTTVTRYPTPTGAVHLEPGTFGWSDHCAGIAGAAAAIALGARMIEKHVQLPFQARRHAPWEATVEEFRALRAFADEDPGRFVGRWQHVSQEVLA
jgi:sialic acid synthase SpsE